MRHRPRHTPGSEGTDAQDGPFASFTDLLSGIVLMFLLMIALLLMRQEGAVSTPMPPVEDLRPKIEELQAKNMELSNKDAQTLQKLAAAQNALETLKSDLRNRPRFRPVMAYNHYDRAIHQGGKVQKYARTSIVYLSEDNALWFQVNIQDKGDYGYMKYSIPTPEEFAAVPGYHATNRACEKFNRDGYYLACGDNYRSTLRRQGNKYTGVVLIKEGTNEYSFETTWEIIGIYDDYFR